MSAAATWTYCCGSYGMQGNFVLVCILIDRSKNGGSLLQNPIFADRKGIHHEAAVLQAGVMPSQALKENLIMVALFVAKMKRNSRPWCAVLQLTFLLGISEVTCYCHYDRSFSPR